MKLYRKYPCPSDRMGVIWTINGIKDAFLIEFGPAGTTHFSIEGLMQFGDDIQTKTFTTHMDENDVTFGDESRLVNAILEIDSVEKPKYIFVLGSSLTAIIGIDIKSIVAEVQKRVHAKLIVLPDCDFNKDFRAGISETLKLLVEHIVSPATTKTKTFNILGIGIHDYNHNSDVYEIKRLMKNYFDMEVGSNFSLDTCIDSIENAGKGQINLVIGEEGLEAAKLLETRYKQPFVLGKPYGTSATQNWLKQVSEALGLSLNEKIEMSEIEKVKYSEKMLIRKIKELKNKFIFLDESFGAMPELKNYLASLGFEYSYDLNEAVLRFDNGIETRAHKNTIQVSHPSFKQLNEYPYTPYMGIRGAYYLCEQINNKL